MNFRNIHCWQLRCHACKENLLFYQMIWGSGHETTCCNAPSIKQLPQSRRLPIRFPGSSCMTCVHSKWNSISQSSGNELIVALYFLSSLFVLTQAAAAFMLICWAKNLLCNAVTHFGMQIGHVHIYAVQLPFLQCWCQMFKVTKVKADLDFLCCNLTDQQGFHFQIHLNTALSHVISRQPCCLFALNLVMIKTCKL